MKRRTSLFATAVLLSAGVLPILAQQNPPADAAATDSAAAAATEEFGQGVGFPFMLLDAALEKHADKQGRVNYANLKDDKNLARFIRAVETADLSRFPIFDKRPELDKDGLPVKPAKDAKGNEIVPEKDRGWEMVFWINAYNAHVLKTISDAFPINSVADIKNFDTAKTHVVAGKAYSLAEIRDKVANFDRRAVFTLSDGTASGPQLLPRAYRWNGINESLEAAVDAVVNNRNNVELTRIQNTVAVSDLFQNYDTTFKPPTGRRKWDGIRFLLSSYINQNADRRYYASGDYDVTFRPRDMTLNRVPNIAGN